MFSFFSLYFFFFFFLVFRGLLLKLMAFLRCDVN